MNTDIRDWTLAFRLSNKDTANVSVLTDIHVLHFQHARESMLENKALLCNRYLFLNTHISITK